MLYIVLKIVKRISYIQVSYTYRLLNVLVNFISIPWISQ